MQRDKQYEELKQLVLTKSNIIGLLKQGAKKYQHLMNLFIQFEEIANKWILEKTRLKQTKTKDQITKYINKAIRYCIVNNIITEEDLEQQIPKCIICGKYFGIPSSSTMKEDAFKIEKHCGDKYCHKKYVYIRTSESVKEKYGVDNISKLQEVQEKKERTLLRKYGVRYMQQSKEIREKTLETLQKKYSEEITNISQVGSIKEKKKETFKKHFGVDNIFKRRDIMEKIWLEKLGVSNPLYKDSETVLKFLHGTNKVFKRKIINKEFIFLSEQEYNIAQYLTTLMYNGYLPSKIYNTIKINEEFLFKDKDSLQSADKAKLWIADIVLCDKYYFEIKPEYVRKEDIDKCIELCNLYNKILILFIQDLNNNLEMSIIKNLLSSNIVITNDTEFAKIMINKLELANNPIIMKEVYTRRKFPALFETIDIIVKDNNNKLTEEYITQNALYTNIL